MVYQSMSPEPEPLLNTAAQQLLLPGTEAMQAAYMVREPQLERQVVRLLRDVERMDEEVAYLRYEPQSPSGRAVALSIILDMCAAIRVREAAIRGLCHELIKE